jgi:hypothetical protein
MPFTIRSAGAAALQLSAAEDETKSLAYARFFCNHLLEFANVRA